MWFIFSRHGLKRMQAHQASQGCRFGVEGRHLKAAGWSRRRSEESGTFAESGEMAELEGTLDGMEFRVC